MTLEEKNAEEAAFLERYENGKLTIADLQALEGWTTVLPATSADFGRVR